MCDNNSKAKAGLISSNETQPRIISFKNLAFTAAALVVPGRTLYMKNLIDFVSESVFKKTGIKLETEIKILE